LTYDEHVTTERSYANILIRLAHGQPTLPGASGPSFGGSMTVVKFEVGKTYQNRRTGDHNLIVSIKVLSRTEKTIRAETDEGVKTLRISHHNGVEQVKPEGSFSKAPIVSANSQADPTGA